jgi:shikimate kinase
MPGRNVVLVGFMGTGKTAVGKLLAVRLGLTFVDMDRVIEERGGMAISRIFAEQGEPYFRALERSLVQELSRRQGLVIATGGGVVLDPDNVADYALSGLVVCLTAAPDVILKRVEKDSHRPLLEQGDKAARILKLLEARRTLYGAIPHQIDTSALTPEAVADRIVALYEGRALA